MLSPFISVGLGTNHVHASRVLRFRVLLVLVFPIMWSCYQCHDCIECVGCVICNSLNEEICSFFIRLKIHIILFFPFEENLIIRILLTFLAFWVVNYKRKMSFTWITKDAHM